MSIYEQYLYHARKFMSDYHLPFSEIEGMELDLLLSLEVVDSKVEAEFEKQRRATRGWKREFAYIDEIL